MLFVELIAQGLVQGSIYALIALGLTLVYGLLRILHVAHAAFFTLGGYIGVLVTNATGSLTLAFLTAMLSAGLMGIAMYRLCYEPILKQPPFVALIASIGLYIAFEELFRIVFGASGLSYQSPPLQKQIEVFGGLTFSQAELMVMGGTVVIIGILGYLQNRTRVGVACQATVSDPQMAESFGIKLRTVRDLNFFIGSALAAFAGVWVALLNNLVEPTMGAVPSYKGLAIIVLGGMGSVRGTLLAALTLGIVESFGTIYLSQFLDRNAIAFAFLILVLMFRPQGLFSKR
ncbi:branched-chain amino acid ABC transporter permease [Eoetvoesiella caeni]|uniref:Branched-chain amino acid transport system permease protein n=1 Tax=Eoetvoesiella caeni TaxID=645616 RepID=A0A366H653_9BURK|nr:branched-chain amino acid ABC transporter permease [Eoetvoesiella caeni]MCI2809944.1 branched-chain amino acid ABC transporter permease [Eoetvoesiella caeni]NYT55820.1 branched-chain amino acid ABC transporter permease [Eoetvoesiella caeni]RBP37569.1 branched-chain amino acid transport system permease protein [Eoetvoesiella caeni]